MIRDRDRIYGSVVRRRLRAMEIRDKPISAGSLWQNCLAEDDVFGTHNYSFCEMPV
jgi:hypothetical protein